MSSHQSFLDLANYYNVFVPNIRSLRAPLNELLKKEKDWSIRKNKVLTSDLFITHNNSDHEIIVASYASSYGSEICIGYETERPITKTNRLSFKDTAEKILLSDREGSTELFLQLPNSIESSTEYI